MSRVRSVRNQRAINDLMQAAKTRHVRKRANELAGITKDIHRTAPRGGTNLNRFGERRSAPGSPPAMETGGLFAAIDQGVSVESALARVQATVIVNLTVLEFGTRKMAPRPLGRISLERFKASVR